MESIYEIVWSIFAIGGGILLLSFREWFIKHSAQTLESWYKKTNLSVFKFQSENMDSTYMRMVSVLVAIIFIAVGIFTLQQNI